jgi:beta-glucosidase
MEMAGNTYPDYLADLVREGHIDTDAIDAAVGHILHLKHRLGLFDQPYVESIGSAPDDGDGSLSLAKKAALESVVLLKNHDGILPLDRDEIESIAVIGPLADAPYEQLGTWIFDADTSLSVSCLEGLRHLVGDKLKIRFRPALETSRSRSTKLFDEAVEVAAKSDVAILFLGEESILSGEAHSRADIGLPGAQVELVRRISKTGTPVILVVLAGRPLTWHPGTMGGPAIADLIFGIECPSGKLPVTFPRMVGQIPIYYSQKMTGKPPSPDTVVHIDEIAVGAPQTSFGMTAFHLDAGYEPLFPFGYGLSYSEFSYDRLRLSADEIPLPGEITIHVEVTNTGERSAEEVVQLYIRDRVGSVTRPVRELKGFRRLRVGPGETVTVEFELHTDDLAFYGRDNTLITEPGDFHCWVGGNSEAELRADFRVLGLGRAG